MIDTGAGLTVEQIATLFRPFAQADASTTRRFGGTGLGLSLSRRLASLLGGDLSVKSTPGEGSTFTLTILIESSPKAASGAAGEPRRATTAPNAAETDVKRGQPLDCRILLAEDSPDNARLISFLLKKAGARVTVVANGQLAVDEALRAKRSGNAFDVILMDMQMPVMDGREATRLLRAERYRGRIVALTANAMADDRGECLKAGCDDYAAKPIDRRHLLAVVRRHLPDRPRGLAFKSAFIASK